ncbi:hypothetical protein EYF80_015700 [Liparis tanakae]|uniref:Uncharacterized protein n=1 Tax=Liparis tanakae TaxID=230148 RepID=A0A4Z2I7P0_9TELE|nr:hypothetical protein EYF80_015700 [Liparis tanakae]
MAFLWMTGTLSCSKALNRHHHPARRRGRSDAASKDPWKAAAMLLPPLKTVDRKHPLLTNTHPPEREATVSPARHPVQITIFQQMQHIRSSSFAENTAHSIQRRKETQLIYVEDGVHSLGSEAHYIYAVQLTAQAYRIDTR